MLYLATEPAANALVETAQANDYDPVVVRRHTIRAIMDGQITPIPLIVEGVSIATADAETLALLRDLLPSAIATRDYSAVAGLVAAGIHSGRIQPLT